MSNNVVVPVKVEKLTKFGYADEKGYVSYSKNMSDSDKALVVPGASFEAEIYTADSGARYLNKIVARAAHVDAPKAQANTVKVEKPITALKSVNTPEVKPIAKAVADVPMTRVDWDNKDARISRQGAIQAAVRAVASFSTQEDVFNNAVLLATQMLEFVNGVK